MSDDEKARIHVDEQVIEQLANTVRLLTAMLERILETRKDQSKEMEVFRDNLKLVRDSIARIAVVLHEGNGERPLVTRVAVLEEQVDGLDEKVDRNKEDISDFSKKQDRDEGIKKEGRWQLWAAGLTGGIALVIQLIQLAFGK